MDYDDCRRGEMSEDLTDIKVDHRFMCPMCKSEDVKVAPMFGSISRCCSCGHKWVNS